MLRPPHQPADQRDQEQNDEDDEDDLGDSRGCGCNPKKPEYRCDNRYDQEYHGPSQHVRLPRGIVPASQHPELASVLPQ